MDNRSASIPAAATLGSQRKPVASRTEPLLTAPILPTLLRLTAPNVLNLLAIVGLITFDGIFVGRLDHGFLRRNASFHRLSGIMPA